MNLSVFMLYQSKTNYILIYSSEQRDSDDYEGCNRREDERETKGRSNTLLFGEGKEKSHSEISQASLSSPVTKIKTLE